MTYEEKERYISNKVGMAYSKQLNEKEQQIIEYLQANTKEVIINSKSFDIMGMLEILKDTINLDEFDLLKVDDGITSYNYNKKTNELVSKYLSRDVEKLTVPFELFDICNIREFKKLQELTITGNRRKLNKKDVDKIIECTNIKKISGNFEFDEELFNDAIYLDNKFITLMDYNGLLIKSNIFSGSSYTNVINSSYEKLDESLDLVKKSYDGIIKKISIKNSNEQEIINYKIKKANDLDENLNKYGKETAVIEIMDIENISDVLNIIELFESKNMKIDLISLHLKNKDYDDIYLLKKLDSKYNFGIFYDKSNNRISLKDFIMMRETLNYYKSMIEEANLSPIEQIMFAYDIIKSYDYQEVDENTDLMESRRINDIIRDGKIVCVGYAVFFTQLLKELNIESYNFGTDVPVKNKNGEIEMKGHQRNIVNVKDDKYGIDGYYAFDPTWDSAPKLVKCIDENGDEKIRKKSSVKSTDRVVKELDEMLLYSYFLIPGAKYQEVFDGEVMPNFEKVKDSNKETAAERKEINSEFENNVREIDEDKLLEMIRVVKLHEGYPIERIEDTLEDAKELNHLAQEVTQKR